MPGVHFLDFQLSTRPLKPSKPRLRGYLLYELNFKIGHSSINSKTFFQVGSLSFSVMAGKIMFREFAYITPDWSVRALDGYIIFR